MEKRKKTAAEKAWQKAYDKEHFRQFTVSLRKDSDADLIEKLDSVPNRSHYLRDLVRADVAGENIVPCRYLVIEHRSDGDTESFVYDTLEKANQAAERLWKELGNSDKLHAHVNVCKVTRDDLSDYAFDEETGEIDWTCYENFSRIAGGMCSEDADHSINVLPVDLSRLSNETGMSRLLLRLEGAERDLILPLGGRFNAKGRCTNSPNVEIPQSYKLLFEQPWDWSEIDLLDSNGSPAVKVEGNQIGIFSTSKSEIFIRAIGGSFSVYQGGK